MTEPIVPFIDIEQQRAALIAAFVDGDDDDRQEIANRHSDVTREHGRVFDIARDSFT